MSRIEFVAQRAQLAFPEINNFFGGQEGRA